MITRKINTICGHKIEAIKKSNGNYIPHSIEGPAIITPDGDKEYYFFGQQHSKSEWKELIRINKKIERLEEEI